jgi:apolipoprotein N-acyltransferase
MGWLHLIQLPVLPGKRPYLAIWLAGLIHWAALMQGVRLAHPALYLGWISLAGYLAVYLILFVGLTRVAVHRLGISIVWAAPIVWTGLELMRGHALTGFSMALLGHVLYRQVTLIQISDIAGAYAVSFLIMFVAAAVARMCQRRRHPSTAAGTVGRFWPLATAGALVLACIAYGQIVLRKVDARWQADLQPAVQVNTALIQDAFDTIFQFDPAREREIFASYLQLSREAVLRRSDLDLIVWPESVYSGTLGELLAQPPLIAPPGASMTDAQFRHNVQAWQAAVDEKNRDVATSLNALARAPAASPDGIWLIAGTDSQRVAGGDVERFNTALLIDPQGNVAARYFKMHLVMFGEYIPFGRLIPWLYQITPITTGFTPGNRPVPFVTPRATIAPSICFESTVPHLIRSQVAALRSQGNSPDLLVNVTNDGWFWGSSMLDHHLACGVFRAIENRLPFLVAANTGLSASIGQDGRIDQLGARRDRAVLFTRTRSVPWTNWYAWWGDIPAGFCLTFCFAVSIVGAADAIRRRKQRKVRNKAPLLER